MSFRFWRRIRLAPGVTLNLSKSTASLSLGPRGAKYTISPRGNRATAGLTGTGLFYTVHDSKRAARGGAAPATAVTQRDKLSLGFFQRLMTPAEERRFVDGIRALNDGNQDMALSALEDAHGLPDAAWMAGMIRLRREEFDRAKAHFRHALAALPIWARCSRNMKLPRRRAFRSPKTSLPMSFRANAAPGWRWSRSRRSKAATQTRWRILNG